MAVLTRLLHALGLHRCFTCGRWKIAHSTDQTARCDYSPLPFRITPAGLERLAEHEQAISIDLDDAAIWDALAEQAPKDGVS